jgi:hypothetical protein
MALVGALMRWRFFFTGWCARTVTGFSYLNRTHITCEPSDWWFVATTLTWRRRPRWASLLVVLFKYRVSIFTVKTKVVLPCWRHCLESMTFLLGENLQSLIERRQRLSIVPLLETSLFENLYYSPGVVLFVFWVALLQVIDHPKETGATFLFNFHSRVYICLHALFLRPRNIRQITSLRNTNKRLLFFLFLFVCIPDVSTCSWHYVVAEAGCNWYPININIFALSKKSNRKKHSRFKIMKVIYYNLSMIFNMEVNRFVCFKFSNIVKLLL